MSARGTNLALFAAIPALVLTGLLSWAVASPGAEILIAAHRVLASVLLVVLAWKYGVAQRSVRRRVSGRRVSTLAVGAITSTALLLTLGIGLAWTTGLVSFDRPLAYSLLNIHVFAGVALVPLVIAHAAQRSAHAAVPFGRRDLLRGAGAVAGGLLVAAALDRVDGSRRSTGSRATAAFPVTSWTFDQIPRVDAPSWRVEVIDGSRHVLRLEDLASHPRVERVATLDCTSGWASTHRWQGVAMRELVPAGRGVRLTSVTGHTATFAPNEIDELLLATHVDEGPLGIEHGAPVRVVAPRHRGYAWIKWLARVEVL